MVRLAHTTAATTTVRRRLHITGTVQGVGFRPTVYRLALELGLTGWVCNDAAGVYIEIQGQQAAKFQQRLINELPPLAQVEQINDWTLDKNCFM